MSDEIDVYLGRSLKNWAASRQSKVPSRESVLQTAAAAPPQDEPTYFRTQQYIQEYSNNRLIGYTTGEWLRGSITFSMAWPANMATMFQLAS